MGKITRPYGTAVGYFTNEKPIKREYPRTELDEVKDSSDFLLQSVDGSYYTIFVTSKELARELTSVAKLDENRKRGRRVEKSSDKVFSLCEKYFKRVSEIYRCAADF